MTIKELLEHASSGASCAGGMAAIVQPLEGQFFGGSPDASIYQDVRKNRKKPKSVILKRVGDKDGKK
jgi:hypothetical protein